MLNDWLLALHGWGLWYVPIMPLPLSCLLRVPRLPSSPLPRAALSKFCAPEHLCRSLRTIGEYGDAPLTPVILYCFCRVAPLAPMLLLLDVLTTAGAGHR